ncbi:MAG: L-arabinose isomerase family protein [Thermogutta sp.]
MASHWQDQEVRRRLGEWSRAAGGRHEFRRVRIARFGGNMREVAVTEGDKVEAQITLGRSVLGWGCGHFWKTAVSTG